MKKITEGFNKMKPERTVLVALDMSKAFDTINIHKLIQKMMKTEIPNTIIKFIANYIKGRQAYTILQDVQSKKRNVKFGVPQGGVLSPTLFNLYMSDIPTPPEDIQLEVYADDMTTLSSNNDYRISQQKLQPYLDKLFQWTEQNDLQLNATKSTATLFTTDPAEYNNELTLTINKIKIPTVKNPKILGIIFDPKLNFGEHVKQTKEKANKTINLMKSLTATKWGKQKETIVTTFKTITRPIIEYGSTIWSPIISDSNLNKLQVVQNAALRTATGCTRDTNLQHLHEETDVLPLKEHLKLHASQLRQKSQLANHPLNKHNHQHKKCRQIRETIFYNKNYTINYDNRMNNFTPDTVEHNKKLIHTNIVREYTRNKSINKVIQDKAPKISKDEEKLPRETRRILSQLRTNKSPILFEYMNKINPNLYPSSLCPLCNKYTHDTFHLFNCEKIPTINHSVINLWNDMEYTVSLLSRWRGAGGLAQ
jgi:hypothetical protein